MELVYIFASETFFIIYPERPREWPCDVLATSIQYIKGANSYFLRGRTIRRKKLPGSFLA